MPSADTQINWKLAGLIGAFLDLAIAYMFLCTSLFVYIALKFVAILGLPLTTSSRNGRFGVARKGKCLQGHLVDCASDRISAVDRLVRSKIPFASITDDGSNRCLELKLRRKNSGDVSKSRIKSEGSSKLLPEQHEAGDVTRGKQNVTNNGQDGLGLAGIQGGTKSKRFVNRRLSNGIRSHRRIISAGSGTLTSISSFDGLQLQAIGDMMDSWPRFSDDVVIARGGDGHPERGPKAVDSQDGRNIEHERSLQQNHSRGSGFDENLTKLETGETEASIHEQVKGKSSPGQSLDRNAENTVRVLEEALKEERAAHESICAELEKERNAAASAADEAMAMITRLQDEKASIEIEARQFERVVEEKSTFDAEEMNILKDILLRREREKHFLEKEVEAYRQLLEETDGLESSIREGPHQTPNTEREKVEEQGDELEVPAENQDWQEKRALLAHQVRKEPEETGGNTPNAEDNIIYKSRDLYKSDSEVTYSGGVHDVHMVKDEAYIGKAQNTGRKLESTCRVSEMARRLPPLYRPRRKWLNASSGSRRKSMTAVDYERLKIENEVELLRERLKAVHDGREELTRRASLPSLSSSKVEVTSEKRRSRRSSLDIHSS
ncbi:PREDICTED: uncharacterized protein LOC104801032 [Tarenaya hassleriana]|uniref:uncharacterized protein LOC104801032 n=1 Tax=Tarenaya hassleriana TaxID=28532 RepID=UPI00053C559B|nr:PREDICTED: uncharacterized protein LOC104801032 [Tarenaya hassleriana]